MPPILTLTMNPALDIATTTERVAPTSKLRCTEPRYDPGGGGINVARAVHMLGGDAVAVFPVGGSSGEMLCRLLDAEGVLRVAVPISGITRESLAVFERQSGQQYRFILPGPSLAAPEQERCLDMLAARMADADCLVASGSLPPGVPSDFYGRVAALAKHHRLRVVLDTSGQALVDAGNDIFLLKASLHELEQLTGGALRGESAEEDAARAVVAEGRAEILVLSLGGRGALLATASEMWRFAAIPVTAAASSVGAGDSLVAGIVIALARGWTLVEAVRFGIAAGTAALLRPGTELCRRDDTERLYRQQRAPPSLVTGRRSAGEG